jgi:hypothetical protein
MIGAGYHIPILALVLTLTLVATLFFFYDIPDRSHIPDEYEEGTEDTEKEDIASPVSL